MQQTSQHRAISAIAVARSSEKLPTIEVLGFSLAGDGLARVVANVVHNRFSRDNHDLVAQSMMRMFDNKLVPVQGSFSSVEVAPLTEKITGVIRVNTQAVAFDGEDKAFRSVSSNIYMDKEDKMWVLRKSASGNLLVKATGIEDDQALADLLDAHCCSGFSLSSEGKAADARVEAFQQGIQGGDFIDYVSAAGDVVSGFVVASVSGSDELVVISAADQEDEAIKRSAVIASYKTDEFPDVEMSEQEEMDTAVAASRGAVDIPHLLAYYKKVYIRSPAFFKEFEKRVRAHNFM